MSIATDNRVTELETTVAKLVKQVHELSEALHKIESRSKPGPKPKGHMQPQDMQ